MLFNKKNKLIIKTATIIYKKIIIQSRNKRFYKELKVPDSLDGRFDLIVLHFFFINTVLNKYEDLEKKLFDEILNLMFKDFDYNLREMGVGDLSVKKKIYHMSEALAGRIKAYENAKKNEKKIINKAIRRNLYGTIKKVDDKCINKMTKYFSDSINIIKKINLLNINENDVIFLDLKNYFN